jgi:hypothetical protein
MLGSQYLMFCSDFGKWRKPPVEFFLFNNSKNNGGANESLPFFDGNRKVEEK